MSAMSKVAEVRRTITDINRLEGKLAELICDAKYVGKEAVLARHLDPAEIHEIERRTSLRLVSATLPQSSALNLDPSDDKTEGAK